MPRGHWTQVLVFFHSKSAFRLLNSSLAVMAVLSLSLAAVRAQAESPGEEFACSIDGTGKLVQIDPARHVVTESLLPTDTQPIPTRDSNPWARYSHEKVRISKAAYIWGVIDDESGLWVRWYRIERSNGDYSDSSLRNGKCVHGRTPPAPITDALPRSSLECHSQSGDALNVVIDRGRMVVLVNEGTKTSPPNTNMIAYFENQRLLKDFGLTAADDCSEFVRLNQSPYSWGIKCGAEEKSMTYDYASHQLVSQLQKFAGHQYDTTYVCTE